MSTQKQIDANRRNALKSTGPKSGDGKTKSSMNALRHGLTAEQAVLPHENKDDYEKFREGLLDSYAPENAAELAIVEELVNANWRLLRLHRVEIHYWEQLGGSYNRGDEGISEALIQTPDQQARNFFRYYAQVERSYYKALAAAKQIQRDKRDRKPLKVMAVAAENGFVSQNREETAPLTAAEPQNEQNGFVSQPPTSPRPADDAGLDTPMPEAA